MRCLGELVIKKLLQVLRISTIESIEDYQEVF